MASDTDHSHAVKTVICKPLISKEKTMKDLITGERKLEDEYKAL